MAFRHISSPVSGLIQSDVTRPEVRTGIRIDIACEEVGGLRGGALEPNRRGVTTPKTSHSEGRGV